MLYAKWLLKSRIVFVLQQAEQKAAERAERLRQEFERRMKPKTKADFDLLYAALESKFAFINVSLIF